MLHEINKCLGLRLGAELYYTYALLPENRRFILFKTRKTAVGAGVAQSVLVFTAEGVFEAQLPANAPDSIERAFAQELSYEEQAPFKVSIDLYHWKFFPYTGSPEELAAHLKQAIEERVLPLPREDLSGVLGRLKELGITVRGTAN